MSLVGNLRKRYANLGAVVLIPAMLVPIFWIMTPEANAAQLQQRGLTISTPVANAVAQHAFKFSFVTMGSDVGSIKFEYCTSPLPAIPCDAPAGLDANGATLDLQSGAEGFALVSAQANSLVLTRPAEVPDSIEAEYVFGNIINPDGTPSTFYVRITTHVSEDASDAETDFGAVVNAITEGVDLSAEVPPLLNFCVGLTIGADCSSAEGNLIDLGDLKTSVVSSGTSQMMAATNALLGLAIGVYGTTMTSGINEIPALTNPTPSAPGNAQFGLNLRSNSNPGEGEDPSGAGVASPTASYNIPNRYTFNSGDIVAISSVATDVRKFTSTYVINISPSTPPGVYTSTLTYICTATF